MADKNAWEVATAGTYADKHVPKAVFVIMLVVALVIMVVPSVGMLWARTDSTSENRELVEAPVLFSEDGSFNGNVLADAGTYLDDHFAYRNQFVSANAHIRAAFGVSSTDQVVIGIDGWLYYGGTLPDYLGQSAMTDRALRNVVHNLSLTQGYVESKGARFAFTLAPNKSELYPEHMPYYYVKSAEPSNAERLKPLLEEAGINYVDLFSLFENEPDEWYLKKDSHWDNRGALMATQALLEAVGREQLPLETEKAVARNDFAGDLESMLYPSGPTTEENWYFSGVNDGEGMSSSSWSYAQGADVTESWVVTNSSGGQGSLLMFRDSFGNALLPLWASSYKQAAFSKLVPYNLPTMIDCKADTVVIERAERHLSYLAENPPILPNPMVQLKDASVLTAAENRTSLTVEENGPYWMVTGLVDESVVREESKLYVSAEVEGSNPVMFDAFWTSVSNGEDGGSADYGFLVYVNKSMLDLTGATLSVYSYDDGVLTRLGVFDGQQKG